MYATSSASSRPSDVPFIPVDMVTLNSFRCLLDGRCRERASRQPRSLHDDNDADDIKYDILIPQHEIILKQGYAGPSASPVNRNADVYPERGGTVQSTDL